MPRVRPVEMDGLSYPISPLSYDEVDEYISQSKEFLTRDPKPTQEDWARRTLETVALALNKGAASTNSQEKWDIKRVAKELDMLYVNKVHADFLSMSGLETKPKGEENATSTSR